MGDHKAHKRAAHHIHKNIAGEIDQKQPQPHHDSIEHQKRFSAEPVRQGTIEHNQQRDRICNKTQG